MDRVESVRSAEWILDYDHMVDKCFRRPGCLECIAPVVKTEDGTYRCVSCGKEYEPDEKMLHWMELRNETKVAYEDCWNRGCGGVKTVESHYVRNPVTLKWQRSYGTCRRCGMRYLV